MTISFSPTSRQKKSYTLFFVIVFLGNGEDRTFLSLLQTQCELPPDRRHLKKKLSMKYALNIAKLMSRSINKLNCTRCYKCEAVGRCCRSSRWDEKLTVEPL